MGDELCQALSLSSGGVPCTVPNRKGHGSFCAPHACLRVSSRLRKIYKERGTDLAAWVGSQPAYIAARSNITDINFEDVKDHTLFQQLHAYLLRCHQLSSQCYEARKAHSAQFYPRSKELGHLGYEEVIKTFAHQHLRALDHLENTWFLKQAKERAWADNFKLLLREQTFLETAHGPTLTNLGQLLLDTRLEQWTNALGKKRSEMESSRQAALNVAKTVIDDEFLSLYVDTERHRYQELLLSLLWTEHQDTITGGSYEEGATPESSQVTSEDSFVIPFETRQEMECRLKNSALAPSELSNLLPRLAQVVAQIFVRLLLAKDRLLPIAMQCESIRDFVTHPTIRFNDILELCAMVSRGPSVKVVHAACLDLQRTEEISQSRWRQIDKFEEQHLSQGIPPDPVYGLDPPRITDHHVIKLCGQRIHICNADKRTVLDAQGWLALCCLIPRVSFQEMVSLCNDWPEFHNLVGAEARGLFTHMPWSPLLPGNFKSYHFPERVSQPPTPGI